MALPHFISKWPGMAYGLVPRERFLPELFPREADIVSYEPAEYGTGDWWHLPHGLVAFCYGEHVYVLAERREIEIKPWPNDGHGRLLSEDEEPPTGTPSDVKRCR